ncbi:HNH endonuclease signature motif containing protein [Propionivibrio sp.]|uniref:HNH endonuclease signature motif containing protein n=1 Tax=Propionivibrio sp. TaxID=2212460 RepID=UPI003BF302E5
MQTPKGYIRNWYGNRQRMEHDVVWERNFGAIPDGHCIHHIDHDKKNNHVSNLQLVSHIEHKRIHSGCELRDGVWFKPCGACGCVKPVTDKHWYFTAQGWPYGWGCRPCHTKKVVQLRSAKRKQRQENRLLGASVEPVGPGQPNV